MIRIHKHHVIAALLGVLALAGSAGAQQVVGPALVAPLSGGGGGTTTLTSSSTATSGCTDGAFLYSLSSLLNCGAVLTTDGSTVTVSNGAAAAPIFIAKDNTTAVFTIADGGNITMTGTLAHPAGTSGAPSVSIGATTQGFYNRGSTRISVAGGGSLIEFEGGAGSYLASGGHYYFNSGALGTSVDVSLTRYAAGVLRVTNGSTGVGVLLGGGTAVASAAAMPVPTGNVFHVTGTTNITSITSTNFVAGTVITLIFDGILTFTDGNNLKLAGNFVTTADDTITLAYDGTNWYEVARAVN